MSGPIVIKPMSDIAGMVQAVDAYVNSAAVATLSLPDNIAAVVKKYYPSPVDKIVNACEALYSCASKLDANGQTLVAQLAAFATIYQWHGLGQTSRGGQIGLAMRRRLGDTTVTQTEDQDPAPRPQFAPPAPVPESAASEASAVAPEPHVTSAT